MIHFSISRGRLEIRNTDLAEDRQKLGSFSPEERPALVQCIASMLRAGWEGHALGSSSMNWPREDGWPDENVTDGFLRPAIREAAAIVAAERRAARAKEPPAPTGERHEGGPTQFGDDWPGLFMRGDTAVPMGAVLQKLLAAVRAGGIGSAGKGLGQMTPMDLAMLDGLATDLASAEVHPGQKVTRLRSFKSCAPEWVSPEHDRLVKACSRLVESIYSDFAGDIPTAIDALAEVSETKGWAFERGGVGHDLYEALVNVSH